MIISLPMLMITIMFLFLIQPTPESTDTPEDDTTDYEVVDTMGDDILEEME